MVKIEGVFVVVGGKEEEVVCGVARSQSSIKLNLLEIIFFQLD